MGTSIERTQAATGRSRLEATRRALELEWSGEHLSALFEKHRQTRLATPHVSVAGYQGAPEMRTLLGRALENSKFSGSRAPATNFLRQGPQFHAVALFFCTVSQPKETRCPLPSTIRVVICEG